MRTQHLRGTTEQLNRLNLPAGRLALNIDNGNIRFWDGETLGGYEVEAQQAYEPPPLPGPQTLMAGDLETGFYGEVPPADFISYGDLSTLVGLSRGTLHNDVESLWLKFSMDGNPAYVAKQSIRYSISHSHLNAQDLVFGRTVEIGDYQYIVRLMTGLVDPDTLTAGGEWNRLMYPIHVDDPNQQGWGINYTNADLNVGVGNGRRSWTQEMHPDSTTLRGYRGASSVEDLNAASTSNTFFGWRPILVPDV